MSDFIEAIGTNATSLLTSLGTVAVAALGVGALIYGVRLAWRLFKGVK